MTLWFSICLAGFILIQPILYKSYEHEALRSRFEPEKAERVGRILGIVSGYAFFAFWIGLWIAPQPRFEIGFFQEVVIVIPFLLPYISWRVPIVHFLAGAAFFLPGGWLGLKGMTELTLQVSQSHNPSEVVRSGIYSSIRHPQYLGGLLSHLGMTLFLSSWLSLACTPIVAVVIYMLCRKEERELIREFGDEYREYRQQVPGFIPDLH